MVTGPGRQDVSEYLMWAGHFKQAYQPAREELMEELKASSLSWIGSGVVLLDKALLAVPAQADL